MHSPVLPLVFLPYVVPKLVSLVFTAGIGENSADIRARVAARLAWLGAVLDPKANAAHALCISASDSRVALYVIPTDEESMIARHTLAALSADSFQ
jgi:acetate kinase